MSAFHVVVRPRRESAPSPALLPLYCLFDVVVDGVSIAARLGEGLTSGLLCDLAHAVVALASARQHRLTVQLYAEDEVWELGLEASGADALVTVFRSGPLPEVAVFERQVALAALRENLLAALAEVEASTETSDGAHGSMKRARLALLKAWPPRARAKRLTAPTHIAPPRRGDIAFTARVGLRGSRVPAQRRNDPQVERADLHALLAAGDFILIAREREATLRGIHVFLLAERLLALAEDALDAWQDARPLFRRVEIGPARIGVRRGPGEGPLDVSVSGPNLHPDVRRMTFPAINATDFAECAVLFAQQLAAAFESTDVLQQANLRLQALKRCAHSVQERIEDLVHDDSVVNPEPEAYRRFAPKPPAQKGNRGPWAHGGKMRFMPKWVATVPDIDLRATFLCGDRVVVGAARESACIDRATGAVVWKVATARGGSVATPSGLVRMEPGGKIHLHDLATGEVRFTTRVTPRTAGGATGAVVHLPGLPKLLVVAEGDRHVTAIDLVTGEVRWRYTSRRPGAFRMRRAGRLLLITGGDASLIALDVATGDVVWRLRGRLPFAHGIAVDHERAFVLSGSASGTWSLHHVDPWTGETRFTAVLDDEQPAPHQAPLVTPDAVVVPTKDKTGVGARAYCPKDGHLLWEQAPGLAAPTTAWLAVDDAVVANSDSGVLLCLEAKNGRVRYNHVFSRNLEADQPRRLEPILRSGALFVPQQSVHVVRPRDGEVLGTIPSDLVPDLVRVDEYCNVYVGEESGHLAAFGAAPRLTLVRPAR